MTTAIDTIPLNRIDGSAGALGDYAGKVRLVVNTASKCGLTPQYEGLEALYRRYREEGFEVIGIPSNDFAGQEPGADAEIADFCKLTYDVDFPLFAKIEVNGDDAAPLYRALKEQVPGVLGTEAIKWNFTKFLISRNGTTIRRFAPTIKPEAIAGDIEAMLAH